MRHTLSRCWAIDANGPASAIQQRAVRSSVRRLRDAGYRRERVILKLTIAEIMSVTYPRRLVVSVPTSSIAVPCLHKISKKNSRIWSRAGSNTILRP